jgi:hypothetical protein
VEERKRNHTSSLEGDSSSYKMYTHI